MFAEYNGVTRNYRTFPCWKEMSKHISIEYRKDIFTYENLMCYEASIEKPYPYAIVYNFLEELFSNPNVIYHTTADNGYFPAIHLSNYNYKKYIDNLIENRGVCYISKIIVANEYITGKMMYFKKGDEQNIIHNRAQRLCLIDNMLKDIEEEL